MIKSILWDVDGTLAETERDGHLRAFNQAFDALGLPWRWSEQRYGELLAVAGGRERLLHDMQSQSRAPVDPQERLAVAERVHRCKNELYATIVAAGELPLREGVRELLEDCERSGVRLGIVTTTSRSNVEILLKTHLGKDWESRFATVISAREAPQKKPHPQAYLVALEALQLRPHEAVAMEDAPAGTAAARVAGVPVIITRSHYFAAADPFAEAGSFATAGSQGVLAAGPSLGRVDGWHPAADTHAVRVGLEQIMRWYERRPGAR
jgi:HAD superfamily hydrolase (TIGR01509 family)